MSTSTEKTIVRHFYFVASKGGCSVTIPGKQGKVLVKANSNYFGTKDEEIAAALRAHKFYGKAFIETITPVPTPSVALIDKMMTGRTVDAYIAAEARVRHDSIMMATGGSDRGAAEAVDRELTTVNGNINAKKLDVDNPDARKEAQAMGLLGEQKKVGRKSKQQKAKEMIDDSLGSSAEGSA